MNKLLITKDRQGIKVGALQQFDMSFKPLSDEELVKELKIEKADELPDGYIAGWASTGSIDHARHVVAAGAFQEAIDQKGIDGPKGIKLLAQHRSDKPAGKIHKLEYRGDRLWIEAQLNLNISYVKDLYEAAKMQGGLSFSVGFYLEEWEWKGKDNDEYLHILKGELFEVSVVTFPCQDEATMTYIKGITDVEAFDTISAFEKALVAAGLAESRNAAAQITRVVKRNSQLFAAAPAKPEEVEPPKELTEIGKALADLKAVFK
jgi:HK97 family phage prohead protease